jgi:hypothetical protein
MFLIREVYFPDIGFIANGLFWSLTTFAIANWRMKVRGVSWAELGLCKPKNYKTAAIAAIAIPVLAIASIVVFQMIYRSGQ